MIHHCNRQAFIILVLFTVPFYHVLFSRYLGLTKRHFSSDISVPFPDSSDLYSRGCYNKLGQHWMKCLYVHGSSIIHLFGHKKNGPLHLSGFSQKFRNLACCTFGKFKFRTLTPSRFKNQTNDTFEHAHQATIETINKGFLNKKLLVSIVAVLT